MKLTAEVTTRCGAHWGFGMRCPSTTVVLNSAGDTVCNRCGRIRYCPEAFGWPRK